MSDVLPAVYEDKSPALTEIANREHQLVVEAGIAMVEHAIRAGETLQQIKEAYGFGAWGQWLDECFDGSAWTANFYMRCATYKHELRARMDIKTLTQARHALKGRRADGDQPRVVPDGEVLGAIAEYLGRGLSHREISRRTGVSRQTVRRYSDPGYRAERGPKPFGRTVLASSVRAIADADSAGELEALEQALRDASEMLERWAEQVRERQGEVAA